MKICVWTITILPTGSLFFLTTTNEEEGGGSSDEDMEGDKELAVEQSCLLLGYILQCLTKCFLYDKIKFLNRERFDSLLQPLVDQVCTGRTSTKPRLSASPSP